MNASSFARLLRNHRLGRGLTHEELAERARLPACAISDLERGLKRAARASTVRRLAEALELTADQAATLLMAAQGGGGEDEQAIHQSPALRNLPRQLSSFVGRTRELAELQRLLERTPLLTLVGTGGVGKTRLALEAAARFAPYVADGLRLVELASLSDSGLVPERLAASLGIIARTEGSLLTTLVEVLGRKQLLLVLDNCEHVVQACAKLVEALLQSCPQLCVLATSREPLGIRGEHVWPVSPLSLADDPSAADSEAVQLFFERAAAVVPSFCLTADNRRSVVEICAHLDGIPLAIELAAARVKTLTPVQIAVRLEDRFDLLVGGSRTAPPRQQTLHAALTWSYELLGVDDRRLFDRLAVFSGGWDLEAAEMVCTDEVLPSKNVLNGLERLVDRSLVLAEQGRYRLLETLRQYADGRLRQNEVVETVRERHAHYYLHQAEAAAPELKRANQAAWFERLALEHDNLRAALRWSLDMDQPGVGLRVAVALQRFWEVRGHFSEARRWFAELLALSDSGQQPSALRAAALAHAGGFAHIQGDNAAARPLLVGGLTLARAGGTRSVAAFALHGLGEMFLSEGDLAAARPVLSESLDLARQLEDGWAVARVLSNLGSLAREEGDIVRARLILEEGLAIARGAGERRVESTLQVNLAMLALEATDLAAATAHLEASLATKRELRDQFGTALVYRVFGWVAFDGGDYIAACHHFREVLSIGRDLGLIDAEPMVLTGLGCVASQVGQLESAMRLFASEAPVARSAIPPIWSVLYERHRPFLEATRERLGAALAERLWSEGRALKKDEIWAEAAAVAQAAARALLVAEVSDSERRASSIPDGLTAREVEIVRLLAFGASNSTIAATLVLSVRTVERHIENVYAKLGVHGRSARAAVATYAVRHGLAESSDPTRYAQRAENLRVSTDEVGAGRR